jgi:hypothetical protein
MFAIAPFCVLPFAVAEVTAPPPTPVIAIYEELVEGRPRVVAEIVAPFVEEQTRFDIPPVNAIDFDALLADVARVEALYRELEEMDDEEVLLLL